MSTTTVIPDTSIVRAQVIVQLNNGTLIHADGKPDTGTFEQSADLGNVFADAAEREAQMQRLLLRSSMRTTATLSWSGATVTYVLPGWRGRWWRLKSWLKAFPLS